jgi:hypothetical protein
MALKVNIKLEEEIALFIKYLQGWLESIPNNCL